MNRPAPKFLRLVLPFILVLALIFIGSPAGADRATSTSAGASPAQPTGKLVESLKLNGLLQPGNPGGVDPELIRQLRQSARGDVSISTNKSTEFASFVRVSKNGDLLPGNRSKTPQGKAVGFLAQYGRLFGVQDAASELVFQGATKDDQGATHLSYHQMYKGVPVFAGILKAHLNRSNALTAMNGAFVPDIALDTTPALSPDQAAERAIADVAANPRENDLTGAVTNVSAADLSSATPTLYVYRDGLIQGVPGPDYLVYEVAVTNGSSVRELVYINAYTGKTVNRISQVEDALFRRLFEQNTDTQVWQEGDPFPGSLNQDQQNIVTFSGNAYYHFLNAFGRDSYDAAGHEMQSVNNDPRISCPNANWNGATTNYCNGVTADDVVAHEWGHAYTEYTDGLVYQWQPGALNEAYSDIWGETVDQINGKGTDSPAPVRTVNACSTSTALPGQLTIHSPGNIAGNYLAQSASFGPALTSPGVTGTVALAMDGTGSGIFGDPSPSIYDACEAITNPGDISGKIALVYRGTCNFTVKVKNAQNAGAIGVIVANRLDASGLPGMGGSDSTITIPSLGISFADGETIRHELANTVIGELTVQADVTPEDSIRWLMGEDSTAFGGAIRDMWNPGCYSDPVKVLDSNYYCSSDDGGGVHTNSGVINHGYSLLVDGGTFNGHTVAPLGLVKAANIYWRAQSAYQNPTTNFSDHADALEASCSDLIGDPLDALGTDPTDPGVSNEVITAGDCAAVHEMTEAVELRTDPTAQCDFKPLLDPNAPALCSDALSGPTPIQSEDFENGLGAWTLSNQGVYSGWPSYDWEQATTLPGGRAGAAAFGTDPDAGNCDAGPGDISGVMHMESPAITIPMSADGSTRLAFDHYVATEAGYDGGNIKISINGGPYKPVPASAFTFNPYNMTLQPAPGNTDPLAGQPAFSGTDGGQPTGSWGQSQLLLAPLGVAPGDTIRLQYDMGMDGCTGYGGWYVDDVNVYSCTVAAPDCSAAAASVTTLTKPNHAFRPINVVGVTDPNNSPLQIMIRSIFQDEAVLAPNSGHTSPDGMGLGTSTAQVRAERVEGGNGRVYYITFMAVNQLGGSCTGTVTVGVPPSKDTTAIGDGPLYDSTQP